MTLTAIGDIHGHVKRLHEVLDAGSLIDEDVLAVGDVGLGFCPVIDSQFFDRPIPFIRGNHDDPAVCRSVPTFVGDYGMWRGCFVCGGADSIDKHMRTPGADWWADEQMDPASMEECLEAYLEVKPLVVISHEAPFCLHPRLVEVVGNSWGPPRGSATAFLLDEMLRRHRPRLWLFGHWHVSFRQEIAGTVFRGLAELEAVGFDSSGNLIGE